MSNSSIWPIDKTLSGATTLCQSGPGCDGNEEVLCIPQSFCITGASSSDCLVSYPGHSLWWGLSPLQRCSRCILQPQPTEMDYDWKVTLVYVLLLLLLEYNKKLVWPTAKNKSLPSWDMLTFFQQFRSANFKKKQPSFLASTSRCFVTENHNK